MLVHGKWIFGAVRAEFPTLVKFKGAGAAGSGFSFLNSTSESKKLEIGDSFTDDASLPSVNEPPSPVYNPAFSPF